MRIVTNKNYTPGSSNPTMNNWLVNQRYIIKNLLKGSPSIGYFIGALNSNPIKYALLNNKGKLNGAAILRNTRNQSRYLNVITARKGFGKYLLMAILHNAARNGKRAVKLSSTNRAKNFYTKHGFASTNRPNRQGTWPMIYKFPTAYRNN
jgi:GNAT superfamily N-acetyltransferase